MKNTDKILSCLMNIVLAPNPNARKEAMEELERLRYGLDTSPKDAGEIIHEFLREMAAPDHYIGYPYIVYAIQICMNDRNYIQNITYGLYPKVAAEFDTTPTRAERAIRHVIETIWFRADYKVLDKYFGNAVSANKGKATNGEFIARMVNLVKHEMKR